MGILEAFFERGSRAKLKAKAVKKKGKGEKFQVEKAPDVQERVEEIVQTLEPGHINQFRIICMRSRGAVARAYARIWSMPKIWQKALDISAFYVIEVLSEHFDKLSEEEKTKTLIHELMHIPKTFSGAILPHRHRGGRIGEREVGKVYSEYRKRKEDKGASGN